MRDASSALIVDKAVLELRDALRNYGSACQGVYALSGVDLDIRGGEMIALVGASGSGKSTLMNVLGCLDRLSDGKYSVAGQDTSSLGPDQLAELRRLHFGFVFQRYNLLPQLSAQANVELPAIYAGIGVEMRRARARALLERLGLGSRLDHYPNQLSGGQQQRVSIARALMNGGQIILADEPTGALDSASGRQVMELLLELNDAGHALIIATHDKAVAAYAHRIVELGDGEIVSDRFNDAVMSTPPRPTAIIRLPGSIESVLETEGDENIVLSSLSNGRWSSLAEAVHMAVIALFSHRLRTSLTLLGVVIGIVSVVTMVALGESARRVMLEDIKGFSMDTLEIYPGTDWGDPDSTRIQTLTPQDALDLGVQSYIKFSSPLLSQSTLLRRRSVSGSANVNGVGPEYFAMSGLPIEFGSSFTRHDLIRQAQVVVIDRNVRSRFFEYVDPIGETLYVGKLPCIVIGVTGRNYQQESRGGSRLNVWIPYTTASARLIGRSYLDSIVVSVKDAEPPLSTEEKLTQLLTKRHRTKDFMVFNLADRIKASYLFTQTMSLLLATIGAVSLTVGGIGVMNIMLVAVTERAREIGVRIAVGARQADIRRQFLIESVLICLIGAAVGVLFSYAIIFLAAYFLPPKWEMHISFTALMVAVACASITGVVFGYFPARNAARLDPVEALARD